MLPGDDPIQRSDDTSQNNSEFFSEQPGVFDTVYNYKVELENDHQILCNFVQAELWRSKKEEWYQDRIVFPLLVYHDEWGT